jgi:hypothetical protein
MPSYLGPVQDSSQGISHEIEEQRGDWITLPHPPLVSEVRTNLAID